MLFTHFAIPLSPTLCEAGLTMNTGSAARNVVIMRRKGKRRRVMRKRRRLRVMRRKMRRRIMRRSMRRKRTRRMRMTVLLILVTATSVHFVFSIHI